MQKYAIFAFFRMNQITILLVDDHPLIRKAWAFLLKQNTRFRLIAECDSGELAVELSKQLCPDIVIMDIRMKGISGIEATQVIQKNCPDSKIIGLSFHDQPDVPQQIIARGARGYLSKSSPPDEIYKAIIEVYEGRIYICQEMAGRIM
jgi:DNA-binding NarL/FixJ family response regulator